ncbi:MAG: hypothetical protein J07HQW1_00342, partial [Haloquadratum walsbyi J07HQW1]
MSLRCVLCLSDISFNDFLRRCSCRLHVGFNLLDPPPQRYNTTLEARDTAPAS